ncbi:MAG: hypothetical protein GYA15_07885 [Leptolinea sp.]|jgi:hypothetical protein|nr:hypothetical protein [Leptolinea sp.]
MNPIRARKICAFLFLYLIFHAGCTESNHSARAATYFVPPTLAVTASPLPLSTLPATAAPAFVPTLESGCSNLLAYINDITIPDGTIFAPGENIDKRWLVENQGTCNWNNRYSLRLTGGDPMGSTTAQSLTPALAGSQTVIRIPFKAPEGQGKYRSAWQAYTPDGVPFGDPIFIVIEVVPRAASTP